MDEQRQQLVEGVQAAIQRLEEAEALLEQARREFGWLKQHDEFFNRLNDFLDGRTEQP
jgi:hypothetical protein